MTSSSSAFTGAKMTASSSSKVRSMKKQSTTRCAADRPETTRVPPINPEGMPVVPPQDLASRPRRNRRSPTVRKAFQETILTPDNFIYPIFVHDEGDENIPITTGISLISTNTPSNGGSEIESVSSVKYFSTRLYSSQYRAVTARDY